MLLLADGVRWWNNVVAARCVRAFPHTKVMRGQLVTTPRLPRRAQRIKVLFDFKFIMCYFRVLHGARLVARTTCMPRLPC